MKKELSEAKENAVSSFFYYMWNAWCEAECEATFGGEYKHFWEKWCTASQKTPRGAAEKFYAELTTDYRIKLVARANELYDGRRRRDNP